MVTLRLGRTFLRLTMQGGNGQRESENPLQEIAVAPKPLDALGLRDVSEPLEAGGQVDR